MNYLIEQIAPTKYLVIEQGKSIRRKVVTSYYEAEMLLKEWQSGDYTDAGLVT